MEQRALIKERAEIVDKAVSRLNNALPTVQEQVYRKVAERINELATDSQGNIKATTANLKIINSIIRKDAKAVFLSDEYEEAVLDFVGSFREIGKVTKRYFKKIEKERG